jgi:hypothetical protein
MQQEVGGRIVVDRRVDSIDLAAAFESDVRPGLVRLVIRRRMPRPKILGQSPASYSSLPPKGWSRRACKAGSRSANGGR